MSNSIGIFMGERGKPTEHKENYAFPVREEQVLSKSGIVVAGRRAIIRSDTNDVMGIVGGNYKVLSHADALNPILDHFKNKDIKPFLRIALTEGGARMYANIYFPEKEMKFKSPDGRHDIFWPGITVINSLDGTLKYNIGETLYRLICTNGLMVPHKTISVTAAHSKNKNFEALVDEVLANSLNIDKYGVFNTWANAALTKAKMVAAAEKIIKKSTFPARYTDLVLAEIETECSGGVSSVWGLYNAFSSVLEHNLIRGKGKFERARMLETALFGAFMKEFKNV